MSGVIAWLDVETTGLHPNPHQLLEVACVVTDENLNILDATGYHAVVKHAPEVRDLSNDYVKGMHDATGLWGKLSSGKALEVIDLELLGYIQRFAPDTRSARLAGNSVRLDANFVNEFLPSVSDHLHYRILDVSSVAYEAEIRGIEMFEKKLLHEAMSDIVESINELAYLREKLYKKEDK